MMITVDMPKASQLRECNHTADNADNGPTEHKNTVTHRSIMPLLFIFKNLFMCENIYSL